MVCCTISHIIPRVIFRKKLRNKLSMLVRKIALYLHYCRAIFLTFYLRKNSRIDDFLRSQCNKVGKVNASAFLSALCKGDIGKNRAAGVLSRSLPLNVAEKVCRSGSIRAAKAIRCFFV